MLDSCQEEEMKQRKRLRPTQAHVPRVFAHAAKQADRQNWWIEIGGSGHLKWGFGENMLVSTSKTPGGPRSVANCLQKLRRAGLQI